MVKTKIIVTLGPSTSSYDVIEKMIEEGVSGFRINFIHGEPKVWDEWIKMVREASEKHERVVSLIGDIPGPQIRVGDFKPYSVEARDKVVLFYGRESDREKQIPIPLKKFFNVVEVGDLILLDDGKVLLKVVDVEDDRVETLALNSAILYPRKKIVISGKEVDLPLLSDRDIEYIRYSVSRDLRYLAVSFIRRATDLNVVRDILSRYGGKQRIIAKIETRSSVNDLENIVETADSVLIARGDLGLHFTLEKLPFIQREIVLKTIRAGKPCILATQLLESMVNYPRPSRSEVVDVMNAVFDLIDALLLTNETAIGKYPVEAVRWLKKIVEVAESNIVDRVVEEHRGNLEYRGLREKYALGLTLLAEKIRAKILIYTKAGTLPPRISKTRPQTPVYVGTSSREIAEALSLYYGLNPYYIPSIEGVELDYDEGVNMLREYLRNCGELNYGDIIAEAYGRREMEIHEIKIKQVV